MTRRNDADATNLDLPPNVGRDAILRDQQAFWTSLPDLRFDLIVDRVRFLTSDVAMADLTRYGELRNRGTWVLVRREGRWPIAALRVMPAETAGA